MQIMKAIIHGLLILALCFAAAGVYGATYDVSGKNGIGDPDGVSFSTSKAPPQTPGQNGGDAREIIEGNGRLRKKGWDAGSLFLTLSMPKTGEVKVQGYQIQPEQSAQEVIYDMLPLHSNAGLTLRAKGGAGGRGGNGGRGQTGGIGRKGEDATRRHKGGDGGHGAPGGNEGRSTDGGDAGRGGQITIRVPIRETDMAMLLDEVDVSGNIGGAAGVGQGVGEGGEGGPGGKSHSWEQTHPVIIPTVDIDSDGDLHFGVGLSVETRIHTMPGGKRGPQGPSGEKHPYVTKPGRNSRDGKFVFEVIDEQGIVHAYDAPYKLALLPDYKLRGSHNGNGFYEPGETIFVEGLTVINTGKSPTPAYQKLKLFISDSQSWIRSDGVELSVPKVLQPGEQYTFATESLHFHLSEPARVLKGVLHSQDVLIPRARVSRVEREFCNFSSEATTCLNVQYPIRITPLESLVTLAPGEAQRVHFKVKNISTQTIGELPDLRQASAVLRRVGGRLDQASFKLVKSEKDTSSDSEGVAQAVQNLGPGEEVIMEAVVGFDNSARAYDEAVIQPELYLQSLLEPNKMNKIQFEPFTLRVAQTFEHQPDADVLLIANHQLNAKAFEALRATAQVKNLKMDIWDFSYHGFFDLKHPIEHFENLFNAYRGKTLIVLGNEIAIPNGTSHVTELLSPDQVIEAARRFGIKVVVINTAGNAADILNDLSEPNALAIDEIPVEEIREYKSPKHFIHELRESIQETQEDFGNLAAFLGIEKMAVSQWRLFGRPKEGRLHKNAQKLLEQAQRSHPEARLYVDYVFDPVQLNSGLFKKWQLGHLHVRRSVDVAKSSLVAIDVTNEQMNDPNFIVSPRFQAAFDYGLNFTTKLKLLNAILKGEFSRETVSQDILRQFPELDIPEPMQFAKTLVQTLLTDLLHEQVTLRPHFKGSQVPKGELWSKLSALTSLTHFDYGQLQLRPATPQGEIFMDLIAAIEFFSHASLSTADKILPWRTKNYQISVATSEMIERLVVTVFVDPATARSLIKSRVEVLRKTARQEKVKRNQLVNFLERKGARLPFLNDSLQPADLRVRTPERQESLRAKERKRTERAQKIRDGVQAESYKRKLSPLECDELFNSPLLKRAAE